jgi:hypothetical protein
MQDSAFESLPERLRALVECLGAMQDMEPKAREALDDAVAIMITLPGLLECMPKVRATLCFQNVLCACHIPQWLCLTLPL